MVIHEKKIWNKIPSMGLQRFKLFTDGQNRGESQVKLSWFIEKTTSY